MDKLIGGFGLKFQFYFHKELSIYCLKFILFFSLWNIFDDSLGEYMVIKEEEKTKYLVVYEK